MEFTTELELRCPWCGNDEFKIIDEKLVCSKECGHRGFNVKIAEKKDS